MPQFNFSVTVPAGGTSLPLSTWQFRFPPKPSLLELMCNAAAVGIVMNLTTGAESIVQAESPVAAGGVAGVLPSRLNNEPIVDKVEPGEEIVLTLRNTTGAGVVVNGVAILTYAT